MVSIERMDAADQADRFQWLEDDADDRTSAWQSAADTETRGALAASSHATAVAAAVRGTFVDLFTSTAPERFGDLWFRKIVPPGRANVVLEVSAGPTAGGRVLVDPSAEGADASLAICWPAHDGTLVLIGIEVDGECRYRILDTADGHVVRRFPEITQATICAWSPDGQGFYFQVLGMAPGADGQPVPTREIWWQPLEGEAERQDLALDHPTSWPVSCPGSGTIAILADQTAPRLCWFRKPGEAWRPFLPGATASYKGVFVDDEYWAITDDLSGWRRLVAIPLDSIDDRATWRELLPARDEIKLMSLTRCGDRFALVTIEGGIMKLHALGLSGRYEGEVPLPSDGAFGLFGLGHIAVNVWDIVGPDGDGCTFVHSSLDRSPAVYRADLATRSLDQLEAPDHALADREVSHFIAHGPQGAISYWILRKRSTPLDGTAAAIVTGYGGFGALTIPHYSPMAAAWTELGGIWVHTQLRGGGERDREFQQAGRMHRKQGTFDDFYAVIEDLHARRFTTPARTGIWGTSNGGLLVGAAVTQRPELIGAAVAQVPILDMVGFVRDPLPLNIVKADYGDPSIPEDAAVMRAYSPYHAIRAGVSYPALLCDTGANDVLCPPWHSRKMIAALSEASASGRRALIRVRGGTGHNAMTPQLFMERDIEELTFFCDELIGEEAR